MVEKKNGDEIFEWCVGNIIIRDYGDRVKMIQRTACDGDYAMEFPKKDWTIIKEFIEEIVG